MPYFGTIILCKFPCANTYHLSIYIYKLISAYFCFSDIIYENNKSFNLYVDKYRPKVKYLYCHQVSLQLRYHKSI